jgi:uncharacterized protein YqgV (UPF0045/DUF77 family)
VSLRLEFTVEPFTEGSPGPHVQAAFEAAGAAGLHVDFGPFGTTVAGADADVLSAADRIVRAAIEAGATRVSLQLVRA